MSIDSGFHSLWNIKDNIKWNDFRKVGVEEDFYDYYYAEDELYVIRDRIRGSMYLCKAKSPKEAWQSFEDTDVVGVGEHE